MDFSKMDRSQITVAASGFSVMLSLHFTFQLMSQHTFYWKNPKEQKAIIFIILTAPIYAIVSFVGLLDISGSKQLFTYLNSAKECYEALAIAKFLSLMYSYLNISTAADTLPDEIKGREIHHSFPVSLFQPRKMHLNRGTLRALEKLTRQFVIVRPTCSILILALQIVGMYPSWLKWTFAVFLSVSSSLAVYSLLLFYRVFAKEFEPHKPLAKFICIMGVVFFSFWQGLLLGYSCIDGPNWIPTILVRFRPRSRSNSERSNMRRNGLLLRYAAVRLPRLFLQWRNRIEAYDDAKKGLSRPPKKKLSKTKLAV